MLPLLQFASYPNEHHFKEAVQSLSQYFKLTEEEKNKPYPNNKLPVFYDRTHCALTYLKHAGLLIGTTRGFFKLTKRGKADIESKS